MAVMEIREPLILISIGQSHEDRTLSTYEAVRCSWVINPTRAENYKLVLARYRSEIVGAYRPTQWLPSSETNFPGRHAPGRWGFVGERAEPEVWNHYVGKEVPERYRRLGAANPVRFCEPQT